MFSQPRSRSTANSRNSFVYRLFATRSFFSCKCVITHSLILGAQWSHPRKPSVFWVTSEAEKRHPTSVSAKGREIPVAARHLLAQCGPIVRGPRLLRGVHGRVATNLLDEHVKPNAAQSLINHPL